LAAEFDISRAPDRCEFVREGAKGGEKSPRHDRSSAPLANQAVRPAV
jgi:hypothetical protein